MSNKSRAAAIDDYVARVVADFPPLTNEQRDKLTVILRREQGIPVAPPRPSPEVIEPHAALDHDDQLDGERSRTRDNLTAAIHLEQRRARRTA